MPPSRAAPTLGDSSRGYATPMTVTASACFTENREQLQAVQERPSAVDAAIVAPCVEPHRAVEADQISDDLKELVGW